MCGSCIKWGKGKVESFIITIKGVWHCCDQWEFGSLKKKDGQDLKTYGAMLYI